MSFCEHRWIYDKISQIRICWKCNKKQKISWVDVLDVYSKQKGDND